MSLLWFIEKNIFFSYKLNIFVYEHTAIFLDFLYEVDMVFSKMRRNRGVVTIEFAITASIFFAIIFAAFELMYIIFISAAVDLAQNESVRLARNQLSIGQSYEELFNEYISSTDELWVKLIDPAKFQTNITFFENVSDLANNTVASSQDTSAIAIYSLSYNYDPMFYFFSIFGDIALSRTSFYLQEYERDEFLY